MNRVCIIKQSYYPQHHHVRRDAETLVNSGYEVDVIALRRKGEKSQETIEGVKVYRLPVEHHRVGILRYIFEYTAFFLLALLKLAQLHLKKRYDVVEVDTMPDILVFTALLPKLLGSKVILYMFENMPELFASTFKTGPKHPMVRFLRLCERACASFADRVIAADGIPYKRVLESHGIPGSKIAVVLNVPNEAIFDLASLPAAGNGDHFRVITHGSLLKRYGVQTLIRAVPLLRNDIPGLRVEVVGDGEYRPELERLSQSLGVEEYIHFAGLVPHDRVPYFIALSHVGVAPMIDDVGVPNKIFEYLALGKPVVASAVPSLRDYFGEGCVLYYQPDREEDLARAIIELYQSGEKRASLVSQGKALYEKCQWKVMKQEYLRVYEGLLA